MNILGGVLALTICYAATSRDLPRGIESIHKGRWSGALAGMGYFKAMLFVILPSDKETSSPAFNEFIALLKDTALLSISYIPRFGDVRQRSSTYAVRVGAVCY